jgi:predicted DCC family thiol-disulfide oxidoreductase YuxK
MNPPDKKSPDEISAAGATARRPVFLFDGECALCNATVHQIAAYDRRRLIRYASLQSPLAQEFLAFHGLPLDDFDTAVFIPDWDRRLTTPYHTRARAILHALRSCGGKGRALSYLLQAVPPPLSDRIYRLVARYRRSKAATCLLPAKAIRQQIQILA